jgi:hydrogenase maturation protease
MNEALVDRIVAAVLYEGYILYPYRPSVKNRQRWTFGGLFPRSYSEVHEGSDAWAMQTECLVQGAEQTTLRVQVRFLHLMARQVGELESPRLDLVEGEEPQFRVVERLQVDERLLQTWQEAVECKLGLPERTVLSLMADPVRSEFTCLASRQFEPVRDRAGMIPAVLVREQRQVAGRVEVRAESLAEGLFRVRVRIENHTPLEGAEQCERDEALLCSLVSTHTVLGVRDGAFVSLLDPPSAWAELAGSCRNQGTWPVLVGEPGETDTVLSSPIILYDYPQVAPESPGDLFDCTEIDEILTLRILTMTEDEKRAAAAVDERARALLSRTEALAREQLLGLHGKVRGLKPVVEEECHD